MIKICSICHRMEQNQSWVRVQVTAAEVSHGCCPACYKNVLEEIEQFAGQQRNSCSVADSAIPVYTTVVECA